MTDALDGDGGARSDREQHSLNRLSVSGGFEGRGLVNGSLDAEATEIASHALDAMMHTLRRPDEQRPRPERRAEAFVEMCRRSLARDHHDDATGRRRALPHLSMVVDAAALQGGHPELVADLRAEAEHGGRLSQATLERLSCDCKISRVIIDGPSRVLDVGRASRTISDALWRALVVRDRHCRARGCDRPPGFCEAHHIVYWSRGGPTDLGNLRLLCWQHHRAAHAHDPPRRE